MKEFGLEPTTVNDPNYLNNKRIQALITKSTEHIFSDIIQLFEKIKDVYGDTPNALYDNETNGYQLLDALIGLIDSNSLVILQTRGSKDYEVIDFTVDGSPHTLDIEAISPTFAGKSYILMLVMLGVVGNTGTSTFSLKLSGQGNINSFNAYEIQKVLIAGETFEQTQQIFIPLVAGEIDYQITIVGDATLSVLDMTVIGYK